MSRIKAGTTPGTMRDEGNTREEKYEHNEGLLNFQSLPNIVRVISDEG
jgi:hypothetical protein